MWIAAIVGAVGIIDLLLYAYVAPEPKYLALGIMNLFLAQTLALLETK